ncbi:MAG: hypothetical protein ACNYPE_00745 [Candidatus Azotimanducaceae bacterium WSBS_2022_MAG_OTU7]
MPARLVNIGNRFRGQLEVIGEEDIAIARYRVSITDSTSLDRALLRCLLTGKCDCLVAGQTGSFVHLGTLYNPVLRI